jgi:acyl-CoA synthetase (NDP forming)
MTPAQHDNLRRLLAPRHVAVIGGDDADIAAGQCAAAGFEGPIWGVNPHRKELGGRPCFARVEDLPEGPDAVFLAVPRPVAGDVVGALGRIGAGGVVCYTAGYGEVADGGAARQAELVATAGDLALVGPNCYGLINYVHDAVLWPYGHGGARVERGVALISQSGMLGTNLTMK